jgi:hypothetical protein
LCVVSFTKPEYIEQMSGNTAVQRAQRPVVGKNGDATTTAAAVSLKQPLLDDDYYGIGTDIISTGGQKNTQPNNNKSVRVNNKASCFCRRQCRDSFHRACWTVNIVSIFLNAVSLFLFVFYFAVLNPGTVVPVVPPAGDANCSLSNGTVFTAQQLNSTTVNFCWSVVNRTSSRLQTPYILRLSDWFTNTSDYIAYSGTNNSVVIHDLIPYVPYSASIERYSDIGEDPVVTSLTMTLNGTMHGCSTPKDINFFKSNRSTAKKMIQTCILINVGVPDLVVPCMEAHGMSVNCSECWYREGLCTALKCLGPCTLPESQKCKDCSEQKCFPGCVQCSQVPRWVFPP